MDFSLLDYNISEFMNIENQVKVLNALNMKNLDDLKSEYIKSVKKVKSENQNIIKEFKRWSPISSFEEISEQIVRIISTPYYNRVGSPLKDKQRLISNITKNLAPNIHVILLRALVYEFNSLKVENKDLKVYQFINDYLSQGENIVSFFDKFPVLLDIVHQKIKLTILYVEKVLKDMHDDKVELHNLFGFNLNEDFSLSFSTGDPHVSGKFPIILSSSEKKIIYKPRLCYNDYLYNECLNLIKLHSRRINISQVNMLCKKDYSWSEFVDVDECVSNEEVKEFYYGMGSIISVLFFLGASDIHVENLIARGSSPILIDLECLFSNLDIKSDEHSGQKINQILSRSVLNTGILPMYNDFFKDDISALGAHNNLFKNFKQPLLYQTDDELEIKYMEDTNRYAPKYQNLPSYNSENYNFLKYKDEVYSGFCESFEIILNNRSHFLSLVNKYKKQLTIRHLIKSTAIYSKVLSLSYHPRFLISPIDRKIFISSQLSKYENESFLKYEIDDILNGDIPFVTSEFNSNSINISNRQKFPNQTGQNFYDLWKKRFNEITLKDRDYQLNILKKSFGDQNPTLKSLLSLKKDKGLDAHSIIDKLETYINDKKVMGDRSISWFHTGYEDLNSDNNFNIRLKLQTMRSDLYSGKLGIVICYYFLWRNLKLTKYKERFLELFEDVISNFDIEREKNLGVGVFSGLGGYLYMFSIIDTSSKALEAERIKSDIYKYIFANINNNTEKDILNGTAGLLLYFCKEYNKEKSPIVKKMIDKCVNHLLSSIKCDYRGHFWESSTGGKEILGFSHGTSGILYSLVVANAVHPISDLESLINGVKEFENYHKKDNFWLDTRGNSPKVQNEFYCNGLIGMIISRSNIEEISKYNDLVLGQSLNLINRNSDPCLCHGLLGNYCLGSLLTVFYTSNNFPVVHDNIYKEIIKKYEKYLYSLSINKECLKDNFLDVGLMTGLSGIILGYLSLSYENIPNILMLEVEY